MSDPLRQALQGIWSSAAPAWERHADFVDDRGAKVAQAMLDAAALRPDQRVLEVACGPGGVGLGAADLVGPGGAAVLSDIAPEMTVIAAERANARKLSNVRTAQIDMEQIDFPDAPVPPPGMPGPFSLSENGKLEELLGAAGFGCVNVREVATPMNAGSFDEWWAVVSSLAGPVGPLLAGQPADVGRTIRARAEEALEQFRTDTGSFDLPGLSFVGSGVH
jgi:SAM-dependent methyltransferase